MDIKNNWRELVMEEYCAERWRDGEYEEVGMVREWDTSMCIRTAEWKEKMGNWLIIFQNLKQAWAVRIRKFTSSEQDK